MALEICGRKCFLVCNERFELTRGEFRMLEELGTQLSSEGTVVGHEVIEKETEELVVCLDLDAVVDVSEELVATFFVFDVAWVRR